MTDGKGIAPTRELPCLAEWEEPMSRLQDTESSQVRDVLRRRFDLAASEVSSEEPVCHDRRDLSARSRCRRGDPGGLPGRAAGFHVLRARVRGAGGVCSL
ncbi:MAG: hypothetical protein HY720_32145 [Planctomycetes bacterium]|nr:hypothetical protein [Planctomycetota bacterium]